MRRRRSKILDRYVLSEIFGPLLLGLMAFTFMLLIDAVFELAALIIEREVPLATVGRLLLLHLPYILVMTIPCALLFGILIAVGRLATDSELVALRASGISLFSLYRPIFALSVLLGMLTGWAAAYLQPWGNRALQDMKMEVVARSIAKEVKPRIFFEGLDGKILYVFESPPQEDRWRGVFYTDSLPIGDFVVTVAESGSVEIDEATGHAVLELENSLDYEVSYAQPQRSALSTNAEVAYQLDDQLLASRRERRRAKRPRELDLSELHQWAENPELTERDRLLARVEIHKKFAIPAACLVFGLFGLPLGFAGGRGGRSSGFALSVVIILVYYVLLNNGEGGAAQGKIEPWLAMWLPNIVFLLAGLLLLARRNRDKSLLLGRLDRWVRVGLWGRLRVHRRLRNLRRLQRQRLRIRERSVRPGGERGERDRENGSDLVLRLERVHFRFPNTFDRYVLRLFLRVFVLVLLAVTSIYIVTNFANLVDEVLEHDVPSSVVIDYYKYLSFQIFHRISPLIVLLTTLISFGILARNNEVTAAKALGMSLYRLALPVLLAAAGVAGLSATIGTTILPHSNARVAELRDQIRGIGTIRTYRRADQQWLYGRGGFIYHFQYYDPRRQALQRLHVFRFDPKSHRLTGHLYAGEAQFDRGRWRLNGAWSKTIDGTEADFQALQEAGLVDLPEEPDFFSTEIRRPEQMGFGELRTYIAGLKLSGQDVPELEVELYNKAALPVVCLVMALVALPFAFRLGQRGALYGIGIALVLGMAFYGLIALFMTLGETATLPALVAVWAPNLLFAIFSLYLFLGIRT